MANNILTKKVGDMNVWQFVIAVFLVNLILNLALVLLSFFLGKMARM